MASFPILPSGSEGLLRPTNYAAQESGPIVGCGLVIEWHDGLTREFLLANRVIIRRYIAGLDSRTPRRSPEGVLAADRLLGSSDRLRPIGFGPDARDLISHGGDFLTRHRIRAG